MNMKKTCFYAGAIAILLTGALASCTKNLNREPANTNTANIQYATAAGYKQVLAKVYGSYALISSQGTGSSDINVTGISDVGETDFIRLLFNMEELTTEMPFAPGTTLICNRFT